MPKIEVRTLKHDQYDDLVNALGVTRAQLAKLCSISPHSIGWWRQSETIPLGHLEAISVELEKKLKGRKDLTAVEQRALNYVRMALISGSAVNSSNSALSPTFAAPSINLDKVPLTDLIAAIRKHGGTVIFGDALPKKK